VIPTFLVLVVSVLVVTGAASWARTRRPVVRLARIPRPVDAEPAPAHVPAFRVLRTDTDLADARARANVALARHEASG
jgi:hypothetical protein